jgi:predicted  nucleic acid-binding Zn-ribbon protein
MSARGEAMVTSRRLDSQLKHARVAAAVDARAAVGQELSIAAIARHAGVSRKFIYAHPELRAQIEQRARQHSRRATAAAVADGQVTVASLRTDLANAKAHNHRLRGQQLRALEQRLSETLGRDVADELDPASERPDELRRELQHARGQIFELTASLADLREELDAVREINRELLADRNRPAH